LLPQQTSNLFEVMQIKLRCVDLGVERVEMNPRGGRLVFNKVPKIDPMVLIQLIQKESSVYKFDGQQILRITKEFDDIDQISEFLDNLLDKLTAKSE